MSSYLSKSKKDFKPKAPIRRGAATSSVQPSNRGSVEYQPQRHTSKAPQIPRVASILRDEISSSVVQADTTTEKDVQLESNEPSNPTPDASNHTHEVAAITDSSTAIEPGITVNAPVTFQSQIEHGDIVNDGLHTTLQPTERSEPASSKSIAGHEQLSNKDQGLDALQSGVSQTTQPAATQSSLNKPHNTNQTAAPVDVNVQTLDDDGTDSEESNTQLRAQVELEPESSTRHKRKQTAEKQPSQDQAELSVDDVSASNARERRLEVQAERIVEAATAASTSKKRKRKPRNKLADEVRVRKKRTKSPAFDEQEEIIPSAWKMGDLCRDPRWGKKSTREVRLIERDEAEALKKQAAARAGLNEFMENPTGVEKGPSTTPAPIQTLTAAANSTSTPVEEASEDADIRLVVPGTRIVNGQIVFDESTRQFDRHAVDDEPPQEVQEVDILSKRINSATHMKRTRAQKWTEDLTERFFDGMRMFGTDFGMIATLFPGWDRKTIKFKYTKELRLDPLRIRQCQSSKERIPVDIAEIERLTGKTFLDPQVVSDKIAEQECVMRAEAEEAKAALVEEEEGRRALARIEATRGDHARNRLGNGDDDDDIEHDDDGAEDVNPEELGRIVEDEDAVEQDDEDDPAPQPVKKVRKPRKNARGATDAAAPKAKRKPRMPKTSQALAEGGAP